MTETVKEIITASAEETEAVGAELARAMTDNASLPTFIALYGDLGVGKTAFVRGFVGALSPAAAVRSPTFALVNEYPLPRGSVFHFDMYRIADEDDLYSIGFYDYLDRGICLTEWSENIPYAIPEQHLRVTISKTGGENERTVKIEAIS